MGSRALAVIGSLLVVGGGGAAGFALTRKATGGMTPDIKSAWATAVARFDSDLRSAGAAVHERATTLAALQQVQAAAATDAATAKDMLERGELAFSPQPGEVVELGQVPTGGKPAVLLVQPAGAPHYEQAATPYATLASDRTAMIVEDVTVTPRERANELTGYVRVARKVDLAPALAELERVQLKGSLAGRGGTLDFGAAVTGELEPAAKQDLPVGVSLTASVAKASGGPLVPLAAGGGGAAVVGLALVVLGMRRRPDPGVAPQLQPANATTAVTASGTAVGTKPVDAGAMIGRWEVIRRLGSGGMADVYLARARGEAGFEKLVAIKVMHPHLARDQRLIDHFLDEARLAARIAHPNVVAIQDLGKIGDDYVIVMEYVDGVDLERLLTSAREARRQVPIDVALGIVCRICDGLHAAHNATSPDGAPLDIVHRDVKSANVLVSKQGAVKVVDFGIAKASQQAHLTQAGETKGTPSMMAPEQRVGELVDVRADVYSVAAVAYEILTGTGVNLDLAALAHLGVDNWPHLPAPTSVRPQLPAELDALLLGAMAFERTKRPDNCAALESSLERLMKQNGLTASDKDIARWVTAELKFLQAAQAPVAETVASSVT